jgi:predicted secreted protein
MTKKHILVPLIGFALGLMALVSTRNAVARPPVDDPVSAYEIGLTMADDGRQISLREDQTLILSLPANPSTGYRWDVVKTDQLIVTRNQEGESQFLPASDQPGAVVYQVLRFKALAEGQNTLTLAYRRPWLRDVPPLRTFSVNVQSVGPFTGANISPAVPTATPYLQLQAVANAQAVSDITGLALPSHFDWCEQGACTPIKDQGNCGSCWAFATVGVLELAIKTRDGVVRDLSEQYLVSCNTESWGCDGGFWAHDYHQDMVPPGEPAAGAVYEADFPYQAADVPCSSPHAHHEKISDWAYVARYGNPPVAAIKQAIYDRGPVGVGVCVGDAFQDYGGGIFQTNEATDCPYGSNHAVVLVGWDDGQGIWYLRNSWGTYWGEKGYMRIKYGISLVGEDATYIVYGDSTPGTPTPTLTPTPTPTPTKTPTRPARPKVTLYLPLILKQSSAPPPASLMNGNFEQGAAGWYKYSQQGWKLILPADKLGVTPHNGHWAAWLGGDNDEISYIARQVTIPTDQPYLAYWHWIQSGDTCGYDFGGVIVNNTTVVDVYDLCMATSTGSSVRHSVNLSAYRGHSVSLQIRAETDESHNSNLFVDDVLFQASAVSEAAGSAWGDQGEAVLKSSRLVAGPATAGEVVRLLHGKGP